MTNELKRAAGNKIRSKWEAGGFSLGMYSGEPIWLIVDTGGATTGDFTVTFYVGGSFTAVPVTIDTFTDVGISTAFNTVSYNTVDSLGGNLFLVKLRNGVTGYHFGSVEITTDTTDTGLAAVEETDDLLPYNATAADLQTRLEDDIAIGVGNVAVADYDSGGGNNGYAITYQGSLANTNVGALYVQRNTLKAQADTITLASPQSGIADDLTNVGISETATPIADGTAYIQSVLVGQGNVGAYAVTVTSLGGDQYQIEFSGAYWANRPILSDDGFFAIQSWTGGGSSVTWDVTTPGTGGNNELQVIDLHGATSGTFTTNPNSGYTWDVAQIVFTRHQEITLTFDNVPDVGSATLSGTGTIGFADSAATIATQYGGGCSGSGSIASGTVTLTFSDYTSHTVQTVDSSTLTDTGLPQRKSYYLADSPTEGKYNITLNGTDYLTNYNDDAATIATATGWGCTGSGTSGSPFILTAPSNAADVTVTVSEDAGNPLRVGVTLTITDVTQGSSPPTAPSSPSATALSSSSIRVEWTDNSSDETSFRVEVSANGSTGWTTAGTTAANATSYDVTGLSADTTYYFRVFAVNGAGDSSPTSNVDATTDEAPATSNAGPLRSPIHSGCKAACYSPFSNQG